jgi:acyl carrier protein
MDTIETLNGIFRLVFDDDSIVLGPETTSDDVEGWDSLSHVNLILAIETQLKIRFTQKELMSFRNVGDLARCIESKRPA